MSLSGTVDAITPIATCVTVLYAQAVLIDILRCTVSNFFQGISDMWFCQQGVPYNNFDVTTLDNNRLRLSLAPRLGRIYPNCLDVSVAFFAVYFACSL